MCMNPQAGEPSARGGVNFSRIQAIRMHCSVVRESQNKTAGARGASVDDVMQKLPNPPMLR